MGGLQPKLIGCLGVLLPSDLNRFSLFSFLLLGQESNYLLPTCLPLLLGFPGLYLFFCLFVSYIQGASSHDRMTFECQSDRHICERDDDHLV